MNKICKVLIFIFVSILCEIAETSPKPDFISKFTFDISSDNNPITDKNINGLKISEALARLSYASFELKIQLDFYRELHLKIIPILNSVFGDEILNEDPFNRKTFITKAYWALHNENKSLLNLANGHLDIRFWDLEKDEQNLFILQTRKKYSLPNKGLVFLKNWMEMLQTSLTDENGNFDVEMANINAMRNIFAYKKVAPVMNELKNIMDAPGAAASQSADPQPYLEDQAREEWKKFLLSILSKKSLHLQGKNLIKEKFAFTFTQLQKDAILRNTEKRINTIQWARNRFEVFYMHLNVIWFLIGGIEKYINYAPELSEAPKQPIKIMQMENEYTKDLTMKIDQMKAMATESIELIKLFVANLKKGDDENVVLTDDEKKEIEEKSDVGNKVLGVLRDHHFISKLGNPKNKINWMALDGANLEAFADYTGQKFDRRNLGMVLQRQLLTEIGALKIVENFMAIRGKYSEKKETKAESSLTADADLH